MLPETMRASALGSSWGEAALGLGFAGVTGIITQNIYHEISPGIESVWETEGDT